MDTINSRTPEVNSAGQPAEGHLAGKPNGQDDNVTPLPGQQDQVALDEFERLAQDAILEDDDGDEPGADAETSIPLVVKKLPRFANFRASETTFDLWGTTEQQGMDDVLYITTKSFAPQFEDDVELKRVRFFETVTSDGVVRLVWCFVPEKGRRDPNLWQKSKLDALEHAQTCWTTMRTRTKLGQHTFRKSAKDYGAPRFSGLTPAQHLMNLKKRGLLVVDKDHPFYRKATDTAE
jgi:hypothetical protein